MEQHSAEGLKDLAQRRLSEIRRMEQEAEQKWNIDGQASVFHCSTPLGVEHGTLRASRLGNVVSIATLTAQDSRYSIAYIQSQLSSLPARYRERFDYWVELIESEGYSRENAERAAFHRTVRLPKCR